MSETILSHPTVAATIKQGKKIRIPPRVTLGELTPNNVGTLKKLNQSLFPVNYSERFYKEVLDTNITPEEYSKLIFYQDLPVGNIICRLEPVSTPVPTTITTSVLAPLPPSVASSSSSASTPAPAPNPAPSNEPQKLYIMTLGVLAPYRRQGLATKLIQHVIDSAIISHNPPPPPAPKEKEKEKKVDEPSDSKKRKTVNSSGDKDKEKEKKKEEEKPKPIPVIESLYLHVQCGNDDAKLFWERNGFVVKDTVKNYYRKIEPRDAWVLEKKIEAAPKKEA